MMQGVYKTIVVGTDGSELAETTVRRASWVALQENAELIIVCAYKDMSFRVGAKARHKGSAAQAGQVYGKKAARAAMNMAIDSARETGAVIAGALLIDGDAAESLLETAESREADLMVIGGLRDRWIGGRLLGDVAGDVLRRANCDVLMVVHPTEVTAEH
ncbi:MAG: universal stress protein [Kocuria sp.]|nr:universal stress protein [Kocuria sp.]